MTDAPILLRLERKLLRELDNTIREAGFKSRNEWFRWEVGQYLTREGARRRAAAIAARLPVQEMTEEEVVAMVKRWRAEKRAKRGPSSSTPTSSSPAPSTRAL